MIRKLRAPAVVVCATAAIFALGGCGLSLQALPKISGLSGATYPLRAVFANVLNLPDNAQVRIGPEVVGQVGTIATQDFKADLTLQIKDSVKLPVGTTAEIRFDNPLGDEYVLLQEPPVLSASVGSPVIRFLHPGSVIPESDTNTAPSVEDTFAALSLFLNGGGLNQLQTIIHELNNTFNGNQPQIRSFLNTIDTGVGDLAQGRTSIDNALASFSNLSQELNGGRNTIANGIDTIAPAIGVLASENQQFSELLTQLSNLGAVGTQVADQSGQNSVNDAQDLLPVVEQLESVSAQLGPDLGDLSSFEAETPKVAPGDYLQASAVVNVFLPPGNFEATPVGDISQTSVNFANDSANSPATGAQAVSDLIAGNL
ncbi:MAG TPA: MlaD family protein [Acidimicrobiales bacterium]|nr:MlaD family protein [Acidimicrobiales bacterium]